jgi:hypothetical protein
MTYPEWLKPSLCGVAVGGVALVIVGFSWGGWVTEGKARQLANAQSHMEVVAALVPICIEQSKQDPKFQTTLALLKDADYYRRSRMLMDAGWATMPGADDADNSVASACMEALAAKF